MNSSRSSAVRRSPASARRWTLLPSSSAHVALDARPALLGLVHGDVGALHEHVDVLAVLGVGGDADAGAELQAHAGDVEVLGDGAPHGGRDRDAGGRRLDRAQEDRELVAAQARDGVVLAQQAREALADLAQHLVAVVVAEGVVDLLEAVEVEQHAPRRRCRRARRLWIACWVRVRKRTRLGRPVSASCRARRSAMSAWRPARWTAIMGSARSGSRTGAESSASTASGARPSRMPSVADWRMSSEEIWSRRREPVVSAMAPATRPVLTTKKTRAGREDRRDVGGGEALVVGQHARGQQDAAGGARWPARTARR